MYSKIALGTVQFGLDYGINNSQGKVSTSDIEGILTLCQQNEINALDTAFAYGNSEERLGQFVLNDFKLISKLPPCNTTEARHIFETSLQRLQTDSLYGYMLHNFSIYRTDKSVWEKLKKFKQEKKVKKIGVSLYAPEELELLWKDNIKLDIVQIPFNLFDQRFLPYLNEMKDREIEIHSRSTFLQGLFFKTPELLPEYFNSAKSKLVYFNELIRFYKLTIVKACLGWVLQQECLDKIVIGVDSRKQLEENINSLQELKEQNIDWDVFKTLSMDDMQIINPSNWKL